MIRYLRFPDLKARGIANNRVTLNDLIENHDFPEGQMLSRNRRGWNEALVDHWCAARPAAKAAKPPLRGAAKRLAERKAEKQPATASPPPAPKQRRRARTAAAMQGENTS
jgi:hypothetical protein